jgi:hypothetical protein
MRWKLTIRNTGEIKSQEIDSSDTLVAINSAKLFVRHEIQDRTINPDFKITVQIRKDTIDAELAGNTPFSADYPAYCFFWSGFAQDFIKPAWLSFAFVF